MEMPITLATHYRVNAPNRLDAILFETFGELRAARESEDRRVVDFVGGLDDARIAGTIKMPPRLIAAANRAATASGAGALAQSPNPSPRANPCLVDRAGRRDAGA
jgi:hypothetical protein